LPREDNPSVFINNLRENLLRLAVELRTIAT